MSTENDKLVLDAIISPLLPTVQTPEEPKLHFSPDSGEETTTEKTSKELEANAVRAAETGHLDEALKFMNESVRISPHRPSGYNNRAQILRMLEKVSDALDDLDKAIELSTGQGLAACQAFTQRAMIHRLQGNDAAAKSDFEEASKLGSSFARNQLIAMNPYAAMCNSMLHDVVRKLQRGDPEDQPDPQHPA